MLPLLFTLILAQDYAKTVAQTTRDLEIQHARILEELGNDRAARAQAVNDIMTVQRDIRRAQDSIKPTLEEVVKEMRQLNTTLAVANAAATSQVQMLQTFFDLLAKAIGSVLAIGWGISKTPQGKKLFAGKKDS